MGPLQWKIFAFAAMGIFIDGYDFFIIATALPVIAAVWNPSPALIGLIGASATIGAVLGASLLGRYADLWGRRTLAMITMSMFALLSVGSAFAWNPASLIVLRFLLGVGIGADYPTGAAYVYEFVPRSLRPQLLFASLSFQAVGAIVGAFIGLALLQAHNVQAWRWMLGFGFVPATIVLYVRRQLPESPRWLFVRGRVEECRVVLGRLFLQPVVLAVPKTPPERSLPFRQLFAPRFIRRTLLTSIPWTSMDVALYGMSLFTPTILASVAFSSGYASFWTRDIKATEGAILLDMVLILGFGVGIWVLRRGGIEVMKLQIVGFAGMLVGLIVVALANRLGSSPLLFLGFAVFNLLVNAGPNGTTYMMPALVFPTQIRATGSGFAASCGKIGASVGIFLIPIVRQQWGLTATVFGVAVLTLIGLLTTVLLRGELKHATVTPEA